MRILEIVRKKLIPFLIFIPLYVNLLMESFLMFPFKVMRRNIALVLAPALPIAFLVAFLVLSGSGSLPELLESTDSYLGGTLYLSAANLTAYNEFSSNVQLPLIRLGGIAVRTDIREAGSDPANFLLIFSILILGFLSYAVVCRAVHAQISGSGDSGILGINPASIILSIVAAFLMVFISSFSLAGFALLLTIGFGVYFTFSIPFAARGDPLGESIFQGFGFISKNMGKIVASYIGSMGIAIMAPIGLLLFTTPLLINLESETVTTALKITLGLFAVIFALFYQMALCAGAVLTSKNQVV
jgi:hypothetical protein